MKETLKQFSRRIREDMIAFPRRASSITAQEKTTALQRQVWLRWLPYWHGFAYLLLVVETILAFIAIKSWQPRLLLVLVVLLWLGWYSICVIVVPWFWRDHPWQAVGYIIADWVLWIVLIRLYVPFFVLLFVLYTQIFLFSSMPWKILLALSLTGLYFWCEVTITGSWIDLNFFVLGITILCIIISVYVDALVLQNYERQRLIDELELTRLELARFERQAGIMQERQRLAHEIYDTLAQGYMGIIMHLEAFDSLSQRVQGKMDIAREHLDKARQIARENLVEARRLIWALQPEELDRASLSEVLSLLIARWSQESGIPATAVVTGQTSKLHPEQELALLRATQEALANVRKHAHASRVVVTLSYMEDMVTLDVQDNGGGIEQDESGETLPRERAGGFGLKGLRERVARLQGTLTIESTPDEGTTLVVALPVEPGSLSLESERHK